MATDSVADDESDFIVYPLLQNDERVAALVIKLSVASTASVALHEFETIGDGSATGYGSRPLAILKDVEMGVTAELGRRRMTVRDLLASRLDPSSSSIAPRARPSTCS